MGDILIILILRVKYVFVPTLERGGGRTLSPSSPLGYHWAGLKLPV